jgi:glycosyltransferase involved in cell wall biosynthesis
MTEPTALSLSGVSVVIPTHNRAALVTRAVASALAQCREGDEVIVVDDDSQDETEARLAPYRDRIVYRRVAHGGAGRARNVGVELARNPLVAFLDSDDEWVPGKLDIQRALLAARPDVLFCFTDQMYRQPSGQEFHGVLRYLCGDDWMREDCAPAFPLSSIVRLPEGQPEISVYIGDVYPKQMEKELPSVVTLVYRREAAGESVRFPEDLETREDWEFVGRLARQGLAAYLDYEAAIVHQHSGPQLTKLDNALLVPARLTLLQRVWGSDEKFLREHGQRYRQVLDQLRLQRARDLLGFGRAGEAREELRQIRQTPIALRLLSHIPGIFTRELVRARRYLRSRLRARDGR